MQAKQKITASLRQSVWLAWAGKNFNAKCTVKWCQSIITPFSFEVGHNIPESRGGATTLENLRPICSICNKSMGNRYTIDEYSALHNTSNHSHNESTTSYHRSSRFFPCCSIPKVKDESE
jgi:5-methylcytosine-specific restriction endonuclease McrA